MPANILDLGIRIILFLQSLGDWLKLPMQFFSFLGNEEFYLVVAPAIYWCWDARLGLRLGLYLMLSGTVNHAFKLAFQAPRPYWYSREVRAFSMETSFGLPSGHSQHAAVIFGRLAAWLRKPWAWISAIVLVFLIGLSRMYLGMHFPTDVLAGWLIGAALLWVLLKLEAPINDWVSRNGAGMQIGAAWVVSLLMIALVWIFQFSLGKWEMNPEWLANIAITRPGDELFNPLSMSSPVSYAATFFGMAAGWVLMKRNGGYDASGKAWIRLGRYIVGVIGMLIIWRGLGMALEWLLPNEESFPALTMRYVRYGLVGMWVTFLAPWVFVRLKLAAAPGLKKQPHHHRAKK